MFRDTSEELERLQAELLAEEESDEALSQEPPEEEYDDCEEEYEEDEEPEVYPNYASGYRAYNSDTSDEELEEYSEDVRAGKTRGGNCLALIACFLALILAGLVLWITYAMGYLG